MNRALTNKIRYVMDEFIPPIIRDSRWFMKLFFMLAYRQSNVDDIMNFKSRVWGMSEEEYETFYSSLNSVSRNRLTDLNEKCLEAIANTVDGSEKVLDVGCGGGYLLKYLKTSSNVKELYGSDLFEAHSTNDFVYVKAHADKLPFADKSMDVVTCCHVLEHLKDPKASINEILRVAKKKVVVVVPCQRPFYYTLDEHINFFTYADQLVYLIGLSHYEIKKVDGDWLYIGEIDE